MLKCFSFFQVFLVSSVTYLTGILTMIGSTVLVTAAMATLGPIILHSPTRLTPLPITDVLPITEQTTEENVIEKEEPIPHVDEQPSLSTKSIDYLLAELMTVVSLPTAFVKFWYSALDQLNSGISPSKINSHNIEPPLMCSNGPCLQTANPNCHNITNSQVWESWDDCMECQNCQEDKQQKLRFRDQDGSSFQSRISNVNNQCQKQTFDWAVRCCCKHGTDPDYTDTVVRNTYADVLVGFNTGFLSPVYVTT